MKNKKAYWLDERRNVDKIFWGLGCLAVLLSLPDFFYDKPVHFSGEAWIGFYSFYGFLSCVGLVLAAKQMRRILKRSEDYYDQ